MKDKDGIKELLVMAVITGENFYKNGLNASYLTREMFQQFLELHKIKDTEFDEAMDELLELGVVYMDGEYYRISK